MLVLKGILSKYRILSINADNGTEFSCLEEFF